MAALPFLRLTDRVLVLWKATPRIHSLQIGEAVVPSQIRVIVRGVKIENEREAIENVILSGQLPSGVEVRVGNGHLIRAV